MGALTDPSKIIRHTSQRHVRRMEQMAFSGVRDSKTYNQTHINVPQRTTKPEHVSAKKMGKVLTLGRAVCGDCVCRTDHSCFYSAKTWI